jgi:hypothetical protein
VGTDKNIPAESRSSVAASRFAMFYQFMFVTINTQTHVYMGVCRQFSEYIQFGY